MSSLQDDVFRILFYSLLFEIVAWLWFLDKQVPFMSIWADFELKQDFILDYPAAGWFKTESELISD